MSYGLQLSRRPPARLQRWAFAGADPTPAPAPAAPGSDAWIHISPDENLRYAQYIDQLVVKLDNAVHYWETDPPGCPSGQRCILVLSQWETDLGAAGPWQSWREAWAQFLYDLQTSAWTRWTTNWNQLTNYQTELLRFVAHARELGLPNVPADLPLPVAPTGPGSTLGDLGKAGDKAAQHVEKILGLVLIGGGIAAAVLIAQEFRK